MYNTLPLINTGAILFTTKVVENLLFVVRESVGLNLSPFSYGSSMFPPLPRLWRDLRHTCGEGDIIEVVGGRKKNARRPSTALRASDGRALRV